MIELEEWQWPYICLNCGDTVYSKWEGQFVACGCFRNETDNKGIAVDQTKYYGRVLGSFYPRMTKAQLAENNIRIKKNNESE